MQTLGAHFSAIDGALKIPGVDISDRTIAEARGALALSCASVCYTFPLFLAVNG